MVLNPHLLSGLRHCHMGKKAALLVLDIAQGIFNYLEGQDKEILYLLIYSCFRTALYKCQR